MGEDVDDVVLVGGMTRMPLVQQRVKECFGLEPQRGAIQMRWLHLGLPSRRSP